MNTLSDKNTILKKALSEIKRLKKEKEEVSFFEQEAIAVIGIGCRFPGGVTSPESFWDALLKQKDLTATIPENRWEQYDKEILNKNPYLQKGGFLTDDIYNFDHRLFRMSPKEVEKTDPHQRLFLKVCWEALENSGYAPSSLRGTKTGIYAGASVYDHIQQIQGTQDLHNPDPNDVMGTGFSFISGRTSYYFGFQGPAITIDTACSSSLVAIDQACKGLYAKDCNMAIAGGVNLMISPDTTRLMGSLNVLSPDCQSRAFDASANGTVRGEGCGIVILKRLSDAKRDGDHIHALIKGSGVNQDGISSGLTAPYGPAQEQLLQEVWKRSNINPQHIDFIETHGTGTALGDPIEITALDHIIPNQRTTPVYLGALKTMTGHLEAAAGIAGLIKTILAIEHGKIPGNLHFKTPTPHIDWSRQKFEIPTTTLSWETTHKRTAAVSSFGLSGTNAHAVIEQYTPVAKVSVLSTKEQTIPEGKQWPFKFSAPSQKGILLQLETFLSFLDQTSDDQIQHLSYSQNKGRADLQERIVLWAENIEELKTTIADAIKGISNPSIIRGKAPKKTVFLFSGGGSQYPEMFHEFYAENPIFRKYMDQCNAFYKKHTQQELLPIIFSSGNTVHQMRYTQVALFVVEYSLARMWMEYGITPDICIGHSTGEYAAACLSGIFSLEDAIKLITTRGELMYALPKNGTMAAVFANEKVVSEKLTKYPNVNIAAVNTPDQTVISGKEKEIHEFCAFLTKEGIDSKILALSHAAHSPLMRPMIADFEKLATTITYRPPLKTMYSTVVDTTTDPHIFATAQYWSNHILSPVRFCKTIQRLKDTDNYTFVEIGPAPALIGMVEEIIETAVETIASNYKDEKTTHQIEKALFQLYVHGATINWSSFYDFSSFQNIRIPNYTFTETHFSLPSSFQNIIAKNQWDSILSTADTSSLNEEAKAQLPVIVEYLKTAQEKASTSDEISPETTLPIVNSTLTFKEVSDVITYIKTILSKELKIDIEELNEQENLLLFGINSIVVARLVTRWKKEFDIALKPSFFLKNNTISQWASLLFKKLNTSRSISGKRTVPSFIAYPEKKFAPFPLNEIQYAYWAGRNPELDWGGVSCSAYFEIDMETLDIPQFISALESLINRHEMLRCRIDADGKQQILPTIETPLRIYPQEQQNQSENHLEKIRSEMSELSIPLGAPMFDIRISSLKSEGYRIHFLIDFLIADALSLFVFWKDLSLLYTGEELPPLQISYKDYLEYHEQRKQTTEYLDAEQYWLQRTKGFPFAPQLPIKDVTKTHANGTFIRRQQWIDQHSWQKFTENAAAQNLTPSAALLTLYSEVLSAWGGGSHFAIMLTVFDRENIHPHINQIIGDFTELALIEIQRKQQAIGLNGVGIQEQMHSDLEHSTYSAINFVKALNETSEQKDRMYPFVFTSALGVDELNTPVENNDFLSHLSWSVSSTPQVWIDHQVYQEKEGITLSWDTLDAVFPENMVNAMFEKYTELVMQAIADNNFWNKEILDGRTSSQQQAHTLVNKTNRPTRNMLLHEGIMQQIKESPLKTAIIHDAKEYSYQKLSKRSNQVADLLQKNGIKKGDKIAIQMRKSFDQIAIVLGILQTGGVYVPFTYDQPVNRSYNILKKANIQFIFTDNYLAFPSKKITQFIPKDIDLRRGVWRPVEISPETLAYIIFTSGSTGTPKGVCIQHQAAMNTILDVNHKLRITADDRVLGLSSLSFDLSVYDIFGLLHTGGTLILPTEEERIDPKSWKHLSETYLPTLWNSVPALMDIYTDYILQNPTVKKDLYISRIIHSGDWIPLALIPKIKSALPNAQLTSMGGATEASIWSNYFHVTTLNPEWKSIPYGYPLANQAFYILDEFNRPCPEWVEGKLHIAGKGLATEYFNEKELTAAAFFYEKNLQHRLYDTGDYGRYRQGNIIEFLGRKDTQLKINGYRVEIGEIQAAFEKCDASLTPLILPIGNQMGHKKLIAFVKKAPSSFDETSLKKKLRQHLPGYFIPEKIIALAEYPITANGKIDRKQLKIKYTSQQETTTSLTPSSDVISAQHPVLELTKQVLHLSSITPTDSFGSLGVSSVDMIRLANELETHFSERPSVGDMIRYETIAQLIDFYADKHIITPDENQKEGITSYEFSLFSKEQIQHLKSMPIIEEHEDFVSFKNTTNTLRPDLDTGKNIPLLLDSKLPFIPLSKDMEASKETISFEDFVHFIKLHLEKETTVLSEIGFEAKDEAYPIQIYLSILPNSIEHIEAGNYYLRMTDPSLRKISSLSEETITEIKKQHPHASFLLHFIADLKAIYPLHKEKSLQFCFMESGSISQVLSAGGTSLQIGSTPLNSYNLQSLSDAFGLTIDHYYLNSLIGSGINSNEATLPSISSIDATALESAKKLLTNCYDQGITLYLKEQQLKYKAPQGTITKELLLELKRYKTTLIALLSDTAEKKQLSRIIKKHEPFRLTPVQLAYMLGRSSDFELGNINTHYYIELECNKLEPKKLEISWNQVIKRHEMLRTKIYSDASQQLMKQTPYFEIPVSVIAQEEELTSIREQWSHHKYELGSWPMFHLQISQINDQRSRLHFSLDCLLLDASSTEMIIQELFATYNGVQIQKPAFSFKDYLLQEEEWLLQHSNIKEATEFWNTQLKKLPPAPELPLKTPYHLIKQPSFKRWKIVLNTTESRIFSQKIKEYRFTPSAVVCTIFMKVLSEWSTNKDFTINLTIFNRLPIHKEVPKIIGDFTNITLISYEKKTNISFLEEVAAVQDQLWKAVEYRTQNGVDLLRRLSKNTPGKAIMPIVFTSLLFGDTTENQTYYPNELKEVYAISQTPQVAMDHQVYERNGHIHINWDIVEHVFDPDWIEEMVTAYHQMLQQLIQTTQWENFEYQTLSLMDK
ncbi:amino acid adenylation domain-containing protein [Aquimarina sp. TRL1]|uniref:non-ribosomal peptide synthetase/type I polyketide synthase n=1 Tax=Aquimarina sp. (strain TRL1) TaxID=2736252 RepID=UPI00158CC6CA|nr:non-ribosomal peptide synthetase/type I polyketide synthase [Aquimarina sp. TRL1]QKX04988.1 amino acid adenylation domain-containing protein [Aquimarina sp. TRL1]